MKPWLLKGQCHDIQWFFALFLREQKVAIARAGVAEFRPDDSLVGRADCLPPTLATLSDSTEDKSIKRRTASLADKEQSSLFSGYEAQASWYLVLQRSRSAVTAL